MKPRRPPRSTPALFLVLALLAAACTPGPGTPSPTADPSPTVPPVVDVRWQVVEVGGSPTVPGAAPWIRLEDGRLRGWTGCNDVGAAVALGAASIRITDMVGTDRACPGPVDAAERAFLQALESAASWRIEDGSLVIDGPGGVLRMVPAPAG